MRKNAKKKVSLLNSLMYETNLVYLEGIILGRYKNNSICILFNAILFQDIKLSTNRLIQQPRSMRKGKMSISKSLNKRAPRRGHSYCGFYWLNIKNIIHGSSRYGTSRITTSRKIVLVQQIPAQVQFRVMYEVGGEGQKPRIIFRLLLSSAPFRRTTRTFLGSLTRPDSEPPTNRTCEYLLFQRSLYGREPFRATGSAHTVVLTVFSRSTRYYSPIRPRATTSDSIVTRTTEMRNNKRVT